MTTIFRATRTLIEDVHTDLKQPHPFAGERVGFFLCRAGRLEDEGVVILAADYHAVADEDYERDDSVGAMMGPAAIRKALQRAYAGGAGDISLFHVHTHEHDGMPGFSEVDVSEARKFVPDFFNVAPTMPHGVIVLSRDRAVGLCWRTQAGEPVRIDRFAFIGAPLAMWNRLS
jgi:hypothetical protein